MQSTIINFTVDEKIKQDAQKVAKKMGISLSMILKNYLKHFVKTKTVVFSIKDETPNQYLINTLKKSERDARAGRVTTFKDAQEELNYLDKEIADERQKRSSYQIYGTI